MARCRCHAGITRQQRHIKVFGQGDIGGIVRCEVVVQLPHPAEQALQREAIHPDRAQRGGGAPAGLGGERFQQNVPPQGIQHLGIDDGRRGEAVLRLSTLMIVTSVSQAYYRVSCSLPFCPWISFSPLLRQAGLLRMR